MSVAQFRAGTVDEMTALAAGLVIAVDLGFSKAERSCGLAWRMPQGVRVDDELEFGRCVETVCDLLHPVSQAALILEAPLSGVFTAEGNPRERGAFEQRRTQDKVRQRHWYLGPGAATCLAALFFCRELKARLLPVPPPEMERTLVLYEGFVSFKTGRTRHGEDARRLRDCFLDPSLLASVVALQPASEISIIAVTDVISDQAGGSAPPILVYDYPATEGTEDRTELR